MHWERRPAVLEITFKVKVFVKAVSVFITKQLFDTFGKEDLTCIGKRSECCCVVKVLPFKKV